MDMAASTDDAAFLERVVADVAALRDRIPDMPPTAFLQTGGGMLPPTFRDVVAVGVPELLSDEEGRTAVDAVRHRSMRFGSKRSAVVFETWICPDDAAVRARVEAMTRRGQDPRLDPALKGMVTIVVESDAGRTIAPHDLSRDADGAQLLVAAERTVQAPGEPMPDHLPSVGGFHVPSADRIRLDAIAWAAHMDRELGDPRDELRSIAAQHLRAVDAERDGSAAT